MFKTATGLLATLGMMSTMKTQSRLLNVLRMEVNAEAFSFT